MEFDIQPDPRANERGIHLPRGLREEMGILLGQFLQLRGREELILEVRKNLDPNQEYALVSHSNFSKIRGQDVEFKIMEVTLGCDPEFFIIWRNTLISATTYLPFAGQIGADGSLGELRPMYAKHEDQVVENLSRLIPQIPHQMKRSSWAKGFPEGGESFEYLAHSYFRGLPAGFHVHLGIPPEILNTRKDFSRAAMNHLVKCLDWYVSVPLVPLEENHFRRLGHSHYGRPGDYRPSNITLEYRTPGAFYLRSPAMARGLLGLCLLLTENVVSRIKVTSSNFVNLHRLSESELQEVMPIPEPNKIKNVLQDRDVKVAKSHLEKIRRELQELPTYGKHEQAVEEFFREVEAGKAPLPNLLHNWKGST
ncbi:MAG: hypothetical protein GF334_03735 [Candidatus Altiarchaeales archaeon]|nr:hypothetical protein [Candidatus Altiarchaeales archaeon]